MRPVQKKSVERTHFCRKPLKTQWVTADETDPFVARRWSDPAYEKCALHPLSSIFSLYFQGLRVVA